jgi:hypothetical protein
LERGVGLAKIKLSEGFDKSGERKVWRKAIANARLSLEAIEGGSLAMVQALQDPRLENE